MEDFPPKGQIRFAIFFYVAALICISIAEFRFDQNSIQVHAQVKKVISYKGQCHYWGGKYRIGKPYICTKYRAFFELIPSQHKNMQIILPVGDSSSYFISAKSLDEYFAGQEIILHYNKNDDPQFKKPGLFDRYYNTLRFSIFSLILLL